MKASAWYWALGLTALWVGCGDDTSGEGGSPGTGGGTTETKASSTSSSSGSTVASSTTSSTTSTGDGGGGGGCPVPNVMYEKGCLTFQGASALCGFSSDETICELAVSCGQSPDLGQCQINCEMGTTVNCYAEADVACLAQAACAADCDALEACGFIL
jgi:hypothetical protein